MATLVLVKKALLDLKDRTGTSLISMNRWIQTNEKVCEETRAVAVLLLFYGAFTFSFENRSTKTAHFLCFPPK